MTMETARLVEQGRDHKVVSRVGHASKVGYHVSKAITKRKCGKKIKHSVPPTVLQQLFVSCRQVFKGPGTVPSPHDVHNLCSILGMFSKFSYLPEMHLVL